MTKWSFHFNGQHPSYSSRRQINVNEAEIASFIFFKIVAEILSFPVAVSSFSFANNFFVVRDRNDINSVKSISALPKKGVSTSSAGRTFFDAKHFANESALALASDIHASSSLRGGTELSLHFLFRSSRLMRHHYLLCRGREASFFFKLSTYFARS